MTRLTDPVMRACNGCRKRKIKCDAATTNTWPCSACTRLKLVCVPPTIGQDGDFVNEGMEPAQEVGSSSTSEASHHAFPAPPTYRDPNQAPMGTMPSYDGMGMYSQFVHAPPTQPGMYNDMRSSPMLMPHQSYSQQPQVFPGPQPPHLATPERGVFPENDQSAADNLSDVLGELKIDESGIGMIFLCLLPSSKLRAIPVLTLLSSTIYSEAKEGSRRTRGACPGRSGRTPAPSQHGGGRNDSNSPRTDAR